VPSSDSNYFRQRALFERNLAAETSHTATRLVHEELAQRYEALIMQLEFPPKKRIVSYASNFSTNNADDSVQEGPGLH
jgi:hypothetical protein